MTARRTVIVHPTPTWYRMKLFNLLYQEIGSKVLLTEPRQLPTYRAQAQFPALSKKIFIECRPTLLFSQGDRLTLKLNPELLALLSSFDVIIWGDYVTSPNVFFLPILKSKGKKIIFWLDEWGFQKPLPRRIIDPLVRNMIKIGDAFIAHGSKHLSYLQSLGIAPDRAFLSGNASHVTVSDSSYKQASEIRGRFMSDVILLYVGGLVQRKRPQWALEAVSNLKEKGINASLILVGSGNELRYLKGFCQQANISDRVLFAGWKDHSDLAPYYLASDIFLFPAINEPWGLVINEAMQFGLPILSSDSIGATDMIIPGQNGYVFPHDSKKEFFAKVEILAKDKILRKTMGAKSLEIVKRFNYERMAESFEKAVLKVCYG